MQANSSLGGLLSSSTAELFETQQKTLDDALDKVDSMRQEAIENLAEVELEQADIDVALTQFYSRFVALKERLNTARAKADSLIPLAKLEVSNSMGDVDALNDKNLATFSDQARELESSLQEAIGSIRSSRDQARAMLDDASTQMDSAVRD